MARTRGNGVETASIPCPSWNEHRALHENLSDQCGVFRHIVEPLNERMRPRNQER